MLDDKASSICAQHYGSYKARENGCDKCPISKACRSGIGDYHKWLAQVNAVARQFAGQDQWSEVRA